MEMKMEVNEDNIKLFLLQKQSAITTAQVIDGILFLKDFGFEFMQLIDCGAYGLVMKSNDVRNNRIVAIKQMIITNQQQLKDAIKESQRVLLLRHPNIIRFYQQLYDNENEAFFIISEFCEKGNLHNYAQSKELTENEIAVLVKEIIEGVHFVHNKNIVHSDLKPQNILLTENGGIKICDLGFSKIIQGSKSKTKMNGGTFAYMPSEQIDGFLRPQSDIFSIGVIICFLCGIKFENDFQIMLKLKEGKIPGVDIQNDKFKALFQIAEGMTKQDYKQRISLTQALSKTQQLIRGVEKNNQISLLLNFNFIFQLIVLLISLIGIGSIYERFIRDKHREKLTQYGTQYLANGDIFEGFLYDGMRHGEGCYYFNPNDSYDKYQGEFSNDKRNGFGVLEWKNGDKYVGEFKEDIMSGKGVMTYRSDYHIFKYEGEFLNNLPNGYGRIEHRNGFRAVGSFKDGLLHGKCIEYYNSDNSVKQFEGNFIYGEKFGFGKIELRNGDIIEGFHKFGLANGKATHYYYQDEQNLKYEGIFLDGKLHGKGILYLKNGQRIEGYNQNGNILNKFTYYSNPNNPEMKQDFILENDQIKYLN